MGAGKVVRGFEEGVSMLALGSQARIHVPAALGYGATEVRANAREF
jgi:FKBP-type peptidyl-prolyl cis-trans isomerase